MKLEDQLSCLAGVGLRLATGRTVAELLHSFPRESYENEPFSLLLFMLGSEVEAEPWGRWFCDRAWSFDTECVYGSGAYVDIASQLGRVAGQPDALSDIRDHIDFDSGEGWIEYSVGGHRRRWKVAISDGQATVLMFLTDAAATQLNALVGKDLVSPAG
jgi:hypothetical protein